MGERRFLSSLGPIITGSVQLCYKNKEKIVYKISFPISSVVFVCTQICLRHFREQNERNEKNRIPDKNAPIHRGDEIITLPDGFSFRLLWFLWCKVKRKKKNLNTMEAKVFDIFSMCLISFCFANEISLSRRDPLERSRKTRPRFRSESKLWIRPENRHSGFFEISLTPNRKKPHGTTTTTNETKWNLINIFVYWKRFLQLTSLRFTIVAYKWFSIYCHYSFLS